MTTTSTALLVNRQLDDLIKYSLESFEYLLAENAKLWEPDQWPHQFVTVIENEVIPALEAIENYDPTP